MPRDVNGTVPISSLLSSPCGCPVLAVVREIIIHPFILFPFWDNTESTLLTHQLGRPAVKAFIHFLIYPLLHKKEFNSQGGWREGQQHPNHPQGSLRIKGRMAPFGVTLRGVRAP